MIQLICPPYNASVDSVDPPLNLLVLGAAVVNEGYEVCLTDLALLYSGIAQFDSALLSDIAQLILNKPSKYIGLTAMCGNYSIALRIAEECKRLDSNKIIILGGPHASFVAEETLTHFSFVDYIIIGEGEITLPELITTLESERSLTEVGGLCFRVEGTVYTNPPRPIIGNLDQTPFPAFDLIDEIDAYCTSPETKYFPIEAGRGCPFNCSFCSTSLFFSRKYRTKSPGRIIDEMKYIRNKWGITHFSLTHDNFTVNHRFVKQFCQKLIESNESFTWSCSSRTDHVNKELFEYMMLAGCNSVFLGIESGSQSIQKVIGKKLDLEQGFELIRELQQLGLSSTVSFIMGFPEETKEDLNQTLDMIIRLYSTGMTNVQLHQLSPFPGTQLYDSEKNELVLDDLFWSMNDMNIDFNLSSTEKEWISRYPQIFSNYYSLKSVDIHSIRQIRRLYYPLARSFFRTLYYLNHLAAVRYTDTIEFVSTRLPSNMHPPQEHALVSILNELIQSLEPDMELAIRDFFSYEQAVIELMQQGNMLHPKDIIKPIKVIQLNYSILDLNMNRPFSSDSQLRKANEEFILLLLESTPTIHGTKHFVRVMSMDVLSISIIQQLDEQSTFQEVVQKFSLENPLVSNEEERQNWIRYVHNHFQKHQLLTS